MGPEAPALLGRARLKTGAFCLERGLDTRGRLFFAFVEEGSRTFALTKRTCWTSRGLNAGAAVWSHNDDDVMVVVVAVVNKRFMSDH